MILSKVKSQLHHILYQLPPSPSPLPKVAEDNNKKSNKGRFHAPYVGQAAKEKGEIASSAPLRVGTYILDNEKTRHQLKFK